MKMTKIEILLDIFACVCLEQWEPFGQLLHLCVIHFPPL